MEGGGCTEPPDLLSRDLAVSAIADHGDSAAADGVLVTKNGKKYKKLRVSMEVKTGGTGGGGGGRLSTPRLPHTRHVATCTVALWLSSRTWELVTVTFFCLLIKRRTAPTCVGFHEHLVEAEIHGSSCKIKF
jgi:hypothetical protein